MSKVSKTWICTNLPNLWTPVVFMVISWPVDNINNQCVQAKSVGNILIHSLVRALKVSTRPSHVVSLPPARVLCFSTPPLPSQRPSLISILPFSSSPPPIMLPSSPALALRKVTLGPWEQSHNPTFSYRPLHCCLPHPAFSSVSVTRCPLPRGI